MDRSATVPWRVRQLVAFDMAYGLVLLPDQPQSSEFVNLSRQLGNDRSPRMLLGDNAYPHLSLVHFEVNNLNTALAIWDDFSREPPGTVQVDLIAVTFSPVSPGDYYTPEGGVSVS